MKSFFKQNKARAGVSQRTHVHHKRIEKARTNHFSLFDEEPLGTNTKNVAIS